MVRKNETYKDTEKLSETIMRRETAFRQRWKEAFDKLYASQMPTTDCRLWEAKTAYKELMDKSARTFPNEPALRWWYSLSDMSGNHYSEHICREVISYERAAHHVSEINHQFRDAVETLKAAHKRIAVEAKRNSHFRAVLTDATKYIEKVAEQLEQSERTLWEELLYPFDKSQWVIGLSEPTDLNEEILPYGIPPPEAIRHDKLMQEMTPQNNIYREGELQTRFQVRVARILRAFLPLSQGVSLRTIARLVVFTYWCAELADVPVRIQNAAPIRTVDWKLIVKATGMPITVGAVDQKLRDSNLK